MIECAFVQGGTHMLNPLIPGFALSLITGLLYSGELTGFSVGLAKVFFFVFSLAFLIALFSRAYRAADQKSKPFTKSTLGIKKKIKH
jgi:uncharacterized membrane protein YtjA (UPF0391 family)